VRSQFNKADKEAVRLERKPVAREVVIEGFEELKSPTTEEYFEVDDAISPDFSEGTLTLNGQKMRKKHSEEEKMEIFIIESPDEIRREDSVGSFDEERKWLEQKDELSPLDSKGNTEETKTESPSTVDELPSKTVEEMSEPKSNKP